MSGLERLSEALVLLGGWGVAAGMLLESAAIPLPSEVILPLAGYLVSAGRLGFWGAVFAATLGGLCGSAASYAVARWGGRPLIRRLIRVGQHELDAAERWFGRYGDSAVFFGRLLPGVRTFIALPAGVGAMPFGRFILYSLLGSLPWNVALIYAGVWLGQRWTALGPALHAAALGLVALAVLALAAAALRSRSAGGRGRA